MSYLILFITLGAGMLLFVPSITADGCGISLTSMPKSEPVILTAAAGSSTYALFKPTGETTTLAVGTKMLLICPGSSNAIQLLEQEQLELFCRTGNVLTTVDNVEYALSQLGCKSIPTSNLKLTSTKCAHDRGYIYKAGFTYNTNSFATVFSICYDNVTENTLYTHNIINGAAIDSAISESTRRAFRADGMKFTTTATNNFYTINNQISRFENYFGEQQTYVDNSMYMARGHLTPDADFVLSYEQLSTYFYSNVAPEFQVVNAGNWIRVENLARSLASNLGEDLEIYNGYMGQLQLPHPTTGVLTSIYMENSQQIEAPKYYFKVLKHQPTDSAIVMITLNNPFAIAADVEEFCTNVCDEAGVYTEMFSDTSRGYTFCCELSDFKQHYADLPDDLTASNLLNESNDVANPDDPVVVEPITNGCQIKMPSDIPNPEPVYILTTMDNTTPRLFRPTGEYTTLPVGSNLTLYCAGSSNKLGNLEQGSLVLTCQEDNSFYSFEKHHTFLLSELNCSRVPTPDILLTSTSCAHNKGYIYKPGFFVANYFVDAFSICYDNVTENTLYSRQIINGATQGFKINESTRRAFRANGMKFTTTATNTFYTINNQIARFQTYFGQNQNYIDNSKFFARGHLSPDADFIFGYEQMSTYYYANVAPQFQVVNAGNWIRVENIARSLATEFESDLLVFTSTLGILQLPTSTNELKSIYLDADNYIEAPKWYYKILMHPQLETDLVMITLNNPYATAADIVEFCPNVCETYGINSPFFSDLSRGYTFCCTLEDFRNAVTDLPAFDLPDDWKF